MGGIGNINLSSFLDPKGMGNSIWNWFQDVTGNSAKQQAEDQQRMANQQFDTAQSWLQNLQDQNSRFAQESRTMLGNSDQSMQQTLGANAADYMQKARAAAAAMAQQNANQGARQAIGTARSAGLNSGQAALVGSQQTGNLFGQGVQAGMNQYGQGASLIGQRAADLQNRYFQGQQNLAQGVNQMANIGSQRAGNAGTQWNQGQQTGQNFWGGVQGVTGAIGDIFSGGATGAASAAGGAAKGV